ncbi:MAG TPA: hypothetical protein PLP20_01465 [Oscillospiraceae bacterium]|nr:hypothetical protein [Oscillospiraceae bacterium]HNW04443.1 hypothetical protein [Oscillospiraceae bacterium]HPV99708.1 hypothetical protein [Oscillospiraceae bacterium]
MKLTAAIELMRACVDTYDRYWNKKNLLSEKLRNTRTNWKGGNSMKTIGIIVGIVSLIIAGAAAAYFFSKKCGHCCEDDDLYDDFPEEEIPPEEDEPAGWKEESPAAEESAGEPAAE